jgi:hypothetical protein
MVKLVGIWAAILVGRWVTKMLGRWVAKLGSAPACYDSSLGSNPDISQKYEMADIRSGQDTLARKNIQKVCITGTEKGRNSTDSALNNLHSLPNFLKGELKR